MTFETFDGLAYVTIPAREYYDEDKNEFVLTKETRLTLKHSLISLSKWESKWKKPFLDSKVPKTRAETLDYIRCMTLTQNVDPLVYESVDAELMDQINKYINDSATATWFSTQEGKTKAPSSREKVTSELIYYWMIAFNIPFEAEKWNLNRLMTLIEVCQVKNQPAKQMSTGQILRRNASLNAQRRAKAHSKG